MSTSSKNDETEKMTTPTNDEEIGKFKPKLPWDGPARIFLHGFFRRGWAGTDFPAGRFLRPGPAWYIPDSGFLCHGVPIY